MLLAMVILLFGCCFLFDYLPNVKKDSKKEKTIYLSLFAISFVILVFFAFDVPIPSVTGFIIALIDKIFGNQVGIT
ncbi:MAG: hypothetical protein GX304_04385 [Clostridiales bacterium]|jgi:hypothetical protein|nr:hypothetical protein [Clostridiales bacterium]